MNYRFGRYVLTKKLAAGGMAEIYRAKYIGEGGFEKKVAIKRLLPAWSADKDFITMLIDEAKALVHLQHHNIVQVFELGKEGESFFISMELIEGLNLGALFNRLTAGGIVLPLKYTIYIICQILEALDFAHKQAGTDGKLLGIVHRDVSPPNVLLSWNGEIKVADFGIAKGAHRTYETTVTQVKGKYSYMSPEQATGQSVDHRTDIYAAGILLYELLTLHKLYDAPNDLEVIELVKKSQIPLKHLHETDPELKDILLKSLKRNREERYKNAADFLAPLNQYALKKGLVTTGFEFGQFLRETFPDEVSKQEKDGIAEKSVIVTSVKAKTRPFGKFTRFKIGVADRRLANRGATIAAILLFAFIPWGPRLMVQNAQAKIETPPPPQPIGAITPPQLSAIINVNARPWGFVTVPGYASKRETPVRNLKVAAGAQTVKVYYEPENQWVTARVDAKGGATTNCFAKFGQNPTLTCK